MDPQFIEDLSLYEGPYISAVQHNPNEFVRDDFRLYHYLKTIGRKGNHLRES
jgi:hypothetical protein